MLTNSNTSSVSDEARKDIEEKIIHLLRIYPKVSPSMMQIGLGSSLPSKIWKPILQDLIELGKIKQEHVALLTHSGRNQTYTVLSLGTAADAINTTNVE